MKLVEITASALFLSLLAFAQDDVTIQHAASSYAGGYITGPASNPLSFLNGPAYRTTASTAPYDFPDFAPASLLNRELPKWISFGWEERFRYEGYHNSGFKLNNNDSYSLVRSRLAMTIRPSAWFKVVGQVQDARPFMQKPPYGPPNLNAWDLKLAYAEFGDPEKQWISVRVGRQLINYNNTIIADSEWRNQGRSYDAVVTNLHYDRFRLGIFAASAVVPSAEGISHHQEGNNIYGLYGAIDHIVPNSVARAFRPLARPAQRSDRNHRQAQNRQAGRKSLRRAFQRLRHHQVSITRRNGSANAATTAPTASTPGEPPSAPATASIPCGGSRACSGSTTTQAATKILPTERMAPSTPCIPPPTTASASPTSSAGRTSSRERVGLTLEPRHRWTVTGQYLDFWLASATDALYNTSGGVIVRDTTGKSGTHIGHELDVYTWYELNRHVNVGVGLGHIFGGEFLEKTTKGPNYNYPYFAINFKDNGKSR